MPKNRSRLWLRRRHRRQLPHTGVSARLEALAFPYQHEPPPKNLTQKPTSPTHQHRLPPSAFDPTTAAQPSRREPLFMPLSSRCLRGGKRPGVGKRRRSSPASDDHVRKRRNSDDDVRKWPDWWRRVGRYSSNGIGSRSLLPSSFHPRCAIRRAHVYRRPHHGGLLSTHLCGANAKTGERYVLSHGERSAGGWIPALSSVPPRKFPRFGRLARHIEHRFARLGADRGGRS